MLGWIVRMLFVLAAPLAALLVPRDALTFGLVQTFVAIILIVALVGLCRGVGLAGTTRGSLKSLRRI